jgi:uncharacterized protein (TIGR00369 family)
MLNYAFNSNLHDSIKKRSWLNLLELCGCRNEVRMGSTTELSEERKIKIIDTFPSVPFVRLLGLELLEIHPESALLRLPMRDELRQPYGLLHGGAIASLIDTATAFAFMAVTDETVKGATSNLTVHYLKAHSVGPVTCMAKVVKSGKRLVTLSAEVHDEDGSLIATAISTYAKV